MIGHKIWLIVCRFYKIPRSSRQDHLSSALSAGIHALVRPRNGKAASFQLVQGCTFKFLKFTSGLKMS